MAFVWIRGYCAAGKTRILRAHHFIACASPRQPDRDDDRQPHPPLGTTCCLHRPGIGLLVCGEREDVHLGVRAHRWQGDAGLRFARRAVHLFRHADRIPTGPARRSHDRHHFVHRPRQRPEPGRLLRHRDILLRPQRPGAGWPASVSDR